MPEAALTVLRDRIRAAVADGTGLRLRGGGTKDFYGADSGGSLLDTRGHAGIVAHDPAELVITARCGTPLDEVEGVLAACRQQLPFEPPHFGAGATIGGCVAAGLAGPNRASSGPLRDFVLGATIMDGQGRVLRFGGQVMKNVAGYDLARLMAGSLGTLSLILEVSLKLLPVSACERSLRFDLSQAEAVRRVNEWAGRPLPIVASAWYAGQLYLRLSGAVAAVEGAARRLGGDGLPPDSAQALWRDLREQAHGFFAMRPAGATLWRLALPATAAPVFTDHDTLVEWHGAQRWICSTRAPGVVREQARRLGGHAVAFRRGADDIATFDALPEPTLAIHRRLKAAFDPAGVFNRGRMYPEL